MNEEQKDQQLDAAYRRASASEAGRPDAKTRAAILAAAAAAARRRTPAANESRYLMRAVAGLAVIGVGLLVWRQTDHRLPGDARTFEVPVAQQSELAAESAYVPDPDAALPQEVQEAGREAAGDAAAGVAEKSEASAARPRADEARAAAPVAPPAAADRPAPADRAVAPAFEQRSASPSTLPPATSPPPPPAAIVSEGARAQDSVDSSALEEVQVTGSRIVPPRRNVGPRNNVPAPASGASSAEQEPARRATSADELLREHFPDQYQSTTPRRIWLVRDAADGVLGSGELAPGQQLDGQMASIRQSLDWRELIVESVQSLRNARGQAIELTLLRAR